MTEDDKNFSREKMEISSFGISRYRKFAIRKRNIGSTNAREPFAEQA
jgi:hypothetical protein